MPMDSPSYTLMQLAIVTLEHYLFSTGKFSAGLIWLEILLFLPFIKPGARGRRPRAWFLEIVLVRASVCVCMCVCVCLSVCPPPRPLITSGVIWCDIGRVRLVKQVLRLFPAFNYFIRHLPSIKWMGVAI